MNNKIDKKQEDIKDKMVKYSFYITYAFLMTTATVTFIEAMRTKQQRIRDILNLETQILVIFQIIVYQNIICNEFILF